MFSSRYSGTILAQAQRTRVPCAPNVLEMESNRRQLITAITDGMRRFPDNVSIQRTSAAMLADFAHSGMLLSALSLLGADAADHALREYILCLGGRELVQHVLSMETEAGDETDEDWRAMASYINLD